MQEMPSIPAPRVSRRDLPLVQQWYGSAHRQAASATAMRYQSPDRSGVGRSAAQTVQSPDCLSADQDQSAARQVKGLCATNPCYCFENLTAAEVGLRSAN